MFKSNFAPVLASILFVSGILPSVAQHPTPLLTQPEDQLIATLRSEVSLKEKMEACRELSVIGSRRAVAPLAALLSDEELSHMARYGLEPLPYEEVDQAFRQALKTLSGRPLVGVVDSIGVRRDWRAVKLLTQRLEDADLDVAQAAARALGSIGTPAAAKSLVSAFDNVSDANRLAFAEGLLRCAEQLPRNAARRIYDRLRKEDSPHQLRAAALRGAILNRGEGGISLLRRSLKSGDLILVDAALRAAREMPGEAVTTALVGCLDGLPDEAQILLLQTLGTRADPVALPAIIPRATSGEGDVQTAAIRALSEIGSGLAVKPLVNLLHNPDPRISQAAQESLAAIPGMEADDAVRELLTSTRKNEQFLAFELVSRRRMTDCMPALFAAAKDPDTEIRSGAIRRVGELGATEEVSWLLEQLCQAEESSNVEAAEQALGAVLSRMDGPESQTPELTRRLTDAASTQKAALVRTLGVVGDAGALAAVRGTLVDAETRPVAIRTLASWKTADAAPELLDLVRSTSDSTERTIALRGYLSWTSHSGLTADARLAMCREAAVVIEHADDKKMLLGALGRIHSLDSLAVVAACLEDVAVHEEACAAIIGIAEALLEGDDAKRVASGLVEPLKRVSTSATNDALIQKAKALLEQAEGKAGS